MFITALGQFSLVQLATNGVRSFGLKTTSDGINGMDQQCLTYYYYMTNTNQSQQIIRVRKEEKSGGNETIDSVTSSSFNGWIKRNVTYNAKAFGYKVKTSADGT